MAPPRSLLLLLPLAVPSLQLSPPRPVIVGTTTDYQAVLFGKLQRAANVYGTNLGQPLAIIEEGEKDALAKKLERVLWDQFCMANAGADGLLEESDLLRPLSSWIPQADLGGALLFVDAASPPPGSEAKKGPFPDLQLPSLSLPPLPFLGGGKGEDGPGRTRGGDLRRRAGAGEAGSEGIPPPPPPPSPRAPPAAVLRCAAARGCSHAYVLASTRTLGACRSALAECAPGVPSTIVCLRGGTALEATEGWASGRAQDVGGDFVGPVGLVRAGDEAGGGGESRRPPLPAAAAEVLPVEDAAEVMVQIALRTERDAGSGACPRIVELFAPADEEDAGEGLVENPNIDYFAMMGGKKARERAGTVKTVASWERLLSPLGGRIDSDVGYRPDKPT